MSGIFVPNSVLPCFPACSDDGDADDGVADDDEHGLHGGRMNVCSLLSCCKY